MKCYFPMVALSTLFLTFFASAQDNILSSESKFLSMDIEKSIISNTENSKNHTTLLAAMKAADLDKILSYDGPFTVFAPSDMAFETMFSNTSSNPLDPENKEELKAILRYHIIAGEFTASKILKAMCSGKGKATFTTVQGEDLTATMQGIDIILTDQFGNSAKIIAADANQCNGVIHEIDSVILPKKISFLP
ncbi:MAG: fasciclin domain-containing protein [Maribacter sp.]|nr:fasciclin domain-containing protein [Maribacter sp.]MBT8315398.1 fasciclin domain-containing protein [Maribacter sp.]